MKAENKDKKELEGELKNDPNLECFFPILEKYQKLLEKFPKTLLHSYILRILKTFIFASQERI